MSGLMFVCWGILYGVIILGWCLIRKFDKVEWVVGKRDWLWILCGSAINSGIIVQIAETDWLQKILLAVVAGCLAFACLTDCKTCQVYQFTWWVAGGAAAILLCDGVEIGDAEFATKCSIYEKQVLYSLLALLAYAVLQEFFFNHMYGRADCHAFVVCAATGCALGLDFRDYLGHMALAFGSLAVVQLFRRNINRKGNLKQPVAFLPYVVISFWMMIYCLFSKKMV